MRLLREDPSILTKIIAEIFRDHGPSKLLTHEVAEYFGLRGKQIKASDHVLLSLFAANRDPWKFDDPGTFDITRVSTEHVGFGHGTHHCLCAALTRLERGWRSPSSWPRSPAWS
jgi:cytochrome P450